MVRLADLVRERHVSVVLIVKLGGCLVGDRATAFFLVTLLNTLISIHYGQHF